MESGKLYSLGVGLCCLIAFLVLFSLLGAGVYKVADATIRLPLLLIAGVMALFATLALVAVTFSLAGLSDETQALGLPEGSVRAVIALSLLLIFAIVVFYFFSSMAGQDFPNDRTGLTDFVKQVITLIGTLVTSITSFYFGSRAASPPSAKADSMPTLTSIAPPTSPRGTAPVAVQINGAGLQRTRKVTLELGGNTVAAQGVTSNDHVVKCEFIVATTLPIGKYDVVATMDDGTSARLPGAFDVA